MPSTLGHARPRIVIQLRQWRRSRAIGQAVAALDKGDHSVGQAALCGGIQTRWTDGGRARQQLGGRVVVCGPTGDGFAGPLFAGLLVEYLLLAVRGVVPRPAAIPRSLVSWSYGRREACRRKANQKRLSKWKSMTSDACAQAILGAGAIRCLDFMRPLPVCSSKLLRLGAEGVENPPTRSHLVQKSATEARRIRIIRRTFLAQRTCRLGLAFVGFLRGSGLDLVSGREQNTFVRGEGV